MAIASTPNNRIVKLPPPTETMAELGNTLSRARRARGISIEDAERDTHVSRRYLQALETEDFSIFPAPVYARGFLRIYARYLGLNPDELLHIFPNGDLDVEVVPLPTVSRTPAQMISVNWIVASLVAIFLLGAGLLLFQGSSNGTQTAPSDGQTNLDPNSAITGPGSQVQSPPAATTNEPVQGSQIGPIRPGELPDFIGADLASSLAVLRENQISYVIVEYANATTPKGIVVDQSPDAGSDSDPNTAITLYVSEGATPE